MTYRRTVLEQLHARITQRLLVLIQQQIDLSRHQLDTKIVESNRAIC